jgi:hypothetical protein
MPLHGLRERVGLGEGGVGRGWGGERVGWGEGGVGRGWGGGEREGWGEGLSLDKTQGMWLADTQYGCIQTMSTIAG